MTNDRLVGRWVRHSAHRPILGLTAATALALLASTALPMHTAQAQAVGGDGTGGASTTNNQDGGAGGSGGPVLILNQDDTTTTGNGEHGVPAFNSGGSGGSGGISNSATGGAGSGGLANGPDSTVVGTGTATGDSGTGGSGTGGAATSGDASGGAGGLGGEISLTNQGAVTTGGNGAHGLSAESTGGDGGNGGVTSGATGGAGAGGEGTGGDATAGFDSIAFGGAGAGGSGAGGNARSGDSSGGIGGAGGDISIINENDLSTSGTGSHGISASSIGGNGDNGGVTGDATGGAGTGGDGTGGDATTGDASVSFGGAGIGGSGTGGNATSGDAFGGVGGAGGDISVVNSQAITTSGGGSHGISATSTGGAGGIGGISGGATGGAGTGGDGTGGDATAGEGSIASGGDGTGGGGAGGNATTGDVSGGAGGAGGDISVVNSQAITTTGNGSHGISATSTGGAGGFGGISGDATGGAGAGGDGTGGDATTGLNGISIGGDGTGGGGTGRNAMSGDSDGGAGGDGGDISIRHSGAILATGTGSHGISAISAGGAGGGGGLVGSATGGSGSAGAGAGGSAAAGVGGIAIGGSPTGGTVTGGTASPSSADTGADGVGGAIFIDSSGTVFANGVGSDGIFARSIGGNAEVLLSGGQVTGGSGTGAGVHLESAENSLIVESNAYLSALSGLAIRMTGGQGTAQNFGTVEGSVFMGGGSSSFVNEAGGFFLSGATVDLDAGAGSLINRGTLSPGGVGAFQTTTLTGNYFQPTGTLLVDAQFTAPTDSDVLAVQGAAELGGLVQVNLINLQQFGNSLTVLTSTGQITDNGIAVLSTPVVDYTLFVGTNDVQVQINDVDFQASGLGPNQASIADHLDGIFDQGPGPFDPTLLFLANLPSIEAYGAGLGRLSPEPYLAVGHGEVRAARRLSEALLTGCRMELAFHAATDHCVWGQLQGTAYEQDQTFDRIGVRENTVSVATGFETSLSQAWNVGAAIAYDHASTGIDDRADISTDRFKAGVVVKREDGPWVLGFGLVAGYGRSDAERSIDLGAPATAESEFDSMFVGGTARAGYRFDVKRWTITPRIDLDVTHVRLDGVDERGAGILNLSTDEVSDTLATLRPGVAFDTEMTLSNGALLRPHLYAGLVIAPDSQLAVSGGFEGSPAGVAPFTVTTETDDLMMEFGAGADLFGIGGARVNAQYRLTVGSDTIQNTAAIKLNMGF